MEKSFLICNMPDTVTDCYMKTILWRRNALFWWPCDSHACLDILEFSKWNKFYNYKEIKIFPPIVDTKLMFH